MATDWFCFGKEMLTSATSEGLLSTKLTPNPSALTVNTRFRLIINCTHVWVYWGRGGEMLSLERVSGKVEK